MLEGIKLGENKGVCSFQTLPKVPTSKYHQSRDQGQYMNLGVGAHKHSDYSNYQYFETVCISFYPIPLSIPEITIIPIFKNHSLDLYHFEVDR